MSDYDLLVIGAGSGGVAASRRASLHGASVAIVEQGRVGGTCVNRGCIPKKLFAYAAHYSEDFHDAAGFGWDEARPAFRWSKLVAAKDREIQRINQVYEGLLDQGQITLLRARARLLDANTVDVDGERISAAHPNPDGFSYANAYNHPVANTERHGHHHTNHASHSNHVSPHIWLSGYYRINF